MWPSTTGWSAQQVADPGRGVRGHAPDHTRGALVGPPRNYSGGMALPLEPRHASPWSPSGAPATRSTPRSWPAGWPPRAGPSSTTPPRPTSPSSTPAGSSSRPRRTPSTPCSRPPTSRRPGAPRPSSPWAAWPSATARRSPTSCPRPTRCSASTPTATCRATSPPSSAATRPASHVPVRPAPAAAALAGRPLGGGASVALPGHGDGEQFVRSRLDARPWAPLKIASGLRPAVLVLRHPDVPRVVRLAPPDRRHRRGALAGASRACASSSSSARTRRPTARTSATCALLEKLLPELTAVRGHRPGAGVLPAAGRGAPRPARGDGRACPGVMPWYDLSFQHASPHGAAPDAPVRRHRAVPRRSSTASAAREPAGRGAQQRHRRLPRRDRGRRRRARALPRRGAARRGRRLRLLRRGRHRGRDARRQAARRRRRRAGRAAHRAGRGAHRPAGRWTGWASASSCSSRSTTTTTRRWPWAGPSTRGPDVDGVCLVRAGAGGVLPRVGSFVEGVVVDAVGVDLVVEAR